MNRTVLKKIIYKTFGEGVYAKAYARGKIRDIQNGVLDEKEAQFLGYFISEDSTVLDIGANYGHYAVDMARICNKGRVYAFEPIPFTYNVLERITRHFDLSNINIKNAAVSHENGRIQMTVPLLDFGAPNTGIAFVSNTQMEQSRQFEVDTIRLDNEPIEGNVDFIKIDIEGHEPLAFKGMEELISKHRPIVLIEFSHSCLNRANASPGEFATYLQKELRYSFTAIAGEQLKLIHDSSPEDGYYFLIPSEKLSNFQNLLTS